MLARHRRFSFLRLCFPRNTRKAENEDSIRVLSMAQSTDTWAPPVVQQEAPEAALHHEGEPANAGNRLCFWVAAGCTWVVLAFAVRTLWRKMTMQLPPSITGHEHGENQLCMMVHHDHVTAGS